MYLLGIPTLKFHEIIYFLNLKMKLIVKHYVHVFQRIMFKDSLQIVLHKNLF